MLNRVSSGLEKSLRVNFLFHRKFRIFTHFLRRKKTAEYRVDLFRVKIRNEFKAATKMRKFHKTMLKFEGSFPYRKNIFLLAATKLLSEFLIIDVQKRKQLAS